MHEFSHWLMAKILFVPTGRMSLTPKFGENSVELGSVQIAKTDFVRRFFIGIAPLLTGISVLIFILFAINSYTFPVWVYLLFAYICITVINTMSLSKSDLSGAWKILLILALALAFLIALH